MLKPATVRQANVPMSDTMMDMDGMSVLLKSCRKKYTTSITRMMAIIKVSATSWIDAKRKLLELCISMNSQPLGRAFDISSSLAEMFLFTSVALAPATWKVINVTPGFLSTSPWKLYDSRPSSTSATSFSRSTVPSSLLRMAMFLNSSTLLSRP